VLRSRRPLAPVQPLPGPDVTPVEERVTYQYNALGRRDPFMPLVGGGYVGADEQLAPADVGGLKVVGIVWGAQDKFALVEDPRGNSSVLRKGDKVMNGTVEGLRRDAVIIKLTFGRRVRAGRNPADAEGRRIMRVAKLLGTLMSVLCAGVLIAGIAVGPARAEDEAPRKRWGCSVPDRGRSRSTSTAQTFAPCVVRSPSSAGATSSSRAM
jgi:hypothetical protein